MIQLKKESKKICFYLCSSIKSVPDNFNFTENFSKIIKRATMFTCRQAILVTCLKFGLLQSLKTMITLSWTYSYQKAPPTHQIRIASLISIQQEHTTKRKQSKKDLQLQRTNQFKVLLEYLGFVFIFLQININWWCFLIIYNL